MVNVKFDGNREAEKDLLFLEENERVLGKNLVIFQCDGRGQESTYVRLKREMGERLGVMVRVEFVYEIEDLKERVKEANKDELTDGILIQLPILSASKKERDETLEMIDIRKDVDGLNPKSKFVPAVVIAVERIMEVFRIEDDQKIALVGSKGMVGTRLGQKLTELGYEFTGFDMGDNLKELLDFEVVICATGATDLIKPEMVREGFVGIDLGFPKAEFSEEAAKKALLITPVPGGVGPLTIVSLYENLAEA